MCFCSLSQSANLDMTTRRCASTRLECVRRTIRYCQLHIYPHPAPTHYVPLKVSKVVQLSSVVFDEEEIVFTHSGDTPSISFLSSDESGSLLADLLLYPTLPPLIQYSEMGLLTVEDFGCLRHHWALSTMVFG